MRAASACRLAALVLACAAAGADAQQGGRGFTLQENGQSVPGLSNADPSAIVAAEIAFLQRAQERGQWTGFRETADKDAVMFVPEVVNAERWLRKKKDPPQSVSWSPDRIFMACDGSYGVAEGHATWPDGRKGGYVTLWRRQAQGDYKWVLDWGVDKPKPGRADGDEETIDGKVAECVPRSMGPQRQFARDSDERRRPQRVKYEVVRIADPPPANGEGQSRDGTLRWRWTTGPDGARTLKVDMREDRELRTVIDDSSSGH